MVRIALPKDVKHIIDVLMENGYEAYAVGGCVRDSILGRVPGDWDITTSALPMQVKGLFRRTVDTGIQHGTVTVMLGRNGYEVTTYRIDGKYEDSRHPESVEFTPKLEEDLKRRDFTINAMAYNDEHGIVDIFDGVGAIGIMGIVLPEYHVMSAEDKAFVGALAKECACQLPERYAAMLFMSGGYSEEDPADTAKRVLKRLKLDNDTINTASMLLRFGMLEITDDEPRIRHIIYETGDKNILRILDFRTAYEKCIGNDIADVRRMYDICNMIFERGDCVSLKNLAITGRELIAMGVPAGRQMGEILNSLLMLVLDNPQLNDRERLSKEALKILNS